MLHNRKAMLQARDVVEGLGQRGGPKSPGGPFLEHQKHQRGIFGQNFFLKNAIKSEF